MAVCPKDAAVYLEDPALLKERGKAPARANEQGQFFPYNCHKVEVSPAQVVKWGASLGVHLGRAGLVAVDVDVDDSRTANAICAFIEQQLGDAIVRTSNGSRLMLFYRAGADLPSSLRVVLPPKDGKAQQVEFFSGLRQVVVHGTHPSGRAYGWRGAALWDVRPESLVSVSGSQVGDAFGQLVEVLGKAGVEASLGGRTAAHAAAPPPPQEDLRAPSIDALRGLPLPPNPPEFGWDDFVRHMYAYRAAGADDLETARELFDAWAAQHPRYDPDVVDVQWGKVERVDDARVGWSWLAEQARYNTAQDEFLADPSLAHLAPAVLARLEGRVEPEEQPGTDASLRPVILDPNDPSTSAHKLLDRDFTLQGTRTHQVQGGVPLIWDGRAYREITADDLRARIWAFSAAAFRMSKNGAGLEPFKPNTTSINNLLDALRAAAFLSPRVAPGTWLDPRPGDLPGRELVAVENGLLHVPTRRIVPHTPRFFNRHSLPFPFTGKEPPPVVWLGFLSSLWDTDQQDQIGALQEWFGLLLTADTSHQKAALLLGPPRGGKGTIVRVAEKLVGRENSCSPTLHGIGTQFGLDPLRGKLLAVVQDARFSAGKAGQSAVVERLLSITGEDALTIDRKHKDPVTERLSTRILIVSNEMPKFSDASTALAKRFLCFQLTRSFYDREDHTLEQRLDAELPSIMAWALDGLDRLRERGRFVQPASSAATVRELLQSSSPITTFVQEECEVGPECRIVSEHLFNAWRGWAGRRGEYPGTAPTFGIALHAAIAGISKSQFTVNGRRQWHYTGICLRDDFDEFAELPGTQEPS
ncbi:MAG TPA: phage/plasmid primase, P4 family [Longimicrobiaceae bacterium]|nr:phage/plasmid primase, P4 family [Longimicrobiaceae bacterium]